MNRNAALAIALTGTLVGGILIGQATDPQADAGPGDFRRDTPITIRDVPLNEVCTYVGGPDPRVVVAFTDSRRRYEATVRDGKSQGVNIDTGATSAKDTPTGMTDAVAEFRTRGPKALVQSLVTSGLVTGAGTVQ